MRPLGPGSSYFRKNVVLVMTMISMDSFVSVLVMLRILQQIDLSIRTTFKDMRPKIKVSANGVCETDDDIGSDF